MSDMLEWFLLIVVIETGVYASIPIKGEKRCGDAIPAMHAIATIDHEDVVTKCIPTGTATVRPRSRPERSD